MYITIGNKNHNGEPIEYSRDAITKEALFSMLTTAAVTNLPAITGEEYKRNHKEYKLLHKELENNKHLSDTLYSVFEGMQSLMWSVADQAYEKGFTDGQEYDNRLDCLQGQQDRVLATYQEQTATDLSPISEIEQPFWDELYDKLATYAVQEGISLLDAAQEFADGIKAQQAELRAGQPASTASEKED